MTRKNSFYRFKTGLTLLLIVTTSYAMENRQSDSISMKNELPITKLLGISESGESYFSPDNNFLILNGKQPGEKEGHTYIVRSDGSSVVRINDKGDDACAYFFPKQKKVIFTSTRDNLDMPKGNWSKPSEYPQGAELYVADYDGKNIKRLTHNKYYDAEVSISNDEKWILFTRQIDGKLDLWRMRIDGSDEQQITFTENLQEGGAFYMPDSETIVFRAWDIKDQAKRGMPMAIYTIKHDGSQLKQLTNADTLNWAPYPSPNGKYFAYVKIVGKHNFEVFLMNIETGEDKRLTFNESFDGYPSISPDGKTLSFTSSRLRSKGERKSSVFLMDVESLNLASD